MRMGSGLDLERIIFIGRTFEEYKRMFLLTEEDIASKRILDCPGGACSFTAGVNKAGGRAVSVDVAYFYPWNVLRDKGKEDISHAMGQMAKVTDQYEWSFFNNIEELRAHRLEALDTCIADMKNDPEHYIAAMLPDLPFEKDKEFDLILSAHFLFMYADRLPLSFHLETLSEMMRVAREEIRIYPVMQLDGQRYHALDEILDFVEKAGWSSELVHVPYEFQKGANQMLKISRN
ncbi:SAM-dependent methyltransferase [Neobacillus mesonae]|nr:SAM-dependent methyltransferase [Neobacillus mesonae]